ncbi:NUDIX domain-containing protein [Clostridiaceae bacterium M8S5]|nr:NUDIX domain-containing protein [Clostridiaceae bacterium M8S5]
MSDNYYWNIRKLIGTMPMNVSTAGMLILDDEDRVLLQLRTDCDVWCLPGGMSGLGENLLDCAIRETFEETNIIVKKAELFGIYSGDTQHHIYPDGNEVYFTAIAYITRDFEGEMKADDYECSKLEFFALDKLPTNIAPSNIPILNDLISRFS